MVSFYQNLTRTRQVPLAFEPELLYQPCKLSVPGRFALCSKSHNAARVEQEIFDVSRLDWVVGQVEKLPERHQKHFWISQATLAPWAVNRRISSIILLNAIWVDIDLAHPPKGFDSATLPLGRNPEHLAALLAAQMRDDGLPEPSYIISTGGGLCAKYLFETSLPSAARARWQSLQRYFVERIGQLGDMGQRWPVDHNSSDAARILRLVGTHNPRWNQPCRIVWGNDCRYDFDYLADCILPYSREQIREFSAKRALYNGWDKNRAQAAAQGIRRTFASQASIEAMMSDEQARVLWNQRFEFGRELLAFRGGVQEGDRNNHFWPMANALAYSCTSAESLTKELASLHHSFFRINGWTQADAMQTAASVARRLKVGNLYKMQTATFLKHLDVSAAELNDFGSLLGSSSTTHNKNRHSWAEGIMEFAPMRGLSSEAFIEETRRRQALAGARSAETRSTTNSIDIREKAHLMRANGLTQSQIAVKLGTSQQTVSRWLKAGV